MLGILLLATLLLAGCSDDSGSGDGVGYGVEEPTASSPTTEPTLPDGQSGEGWHLVEIVHATAVNGEVTTTPTPITSQEEVASYTAQFSRPAMREEIERVVREYVPTDDQQLVAAVISIGCDVPPGVTYADGEVRPLKVTDPLKECLAPVTSVAILAVEE